MRAWDHILFSHPFFNHVRKFPSAAARIAISKVPGVKKLALYIGAFGILDQKILAPTFWAAPFIVRYRAGNVLYCTSGHFIPLKLFYHAIGASARIID